MGGGGGFQLNDVIASTIIEEYEVSQMSMKQEGKLSSLVCPYKGSKAWE